MGQAEMGHLPVVFPRGDDVLEAALQEIRDFDPAAIVFVDGYRRHRNGLDADADAAQLSIAEHFPDDFLVVLVTQGRRIGARAQLSLTVFFPDKVKVNSCLCVTPSSSSGGSRS